MLLNYIKVKCYCKKTVSDQFSLEVAIIYPELQIS